MTLFSRLYALANLRENKVLANKKCFTVIVLATWSSIKRIIKVRYAIQQTCVAKPQQRPNKYQVMFCCKEKLSILIK